MFARIALFSLVVNADTTGIDICEAPEISAQKIYCDSLATSKEIYECYRNLASRDPRLHREYQREKASRRTRSYYLKPRNYNEQAIVAKQSFEDAFFRLCNVFFISPAAVEVILDE